jgi:hypothetical protein
LRAKTSLVAVALLFFNLAWVKPENDTLSFYTLRQVKKPVVHSMNGGRPVNDSLADMDVVNNNSEGPGNGFKKANHEAFYRNLERAASRTSLTRKIYELMTKDPASEYRPSDNPYRAESVFAGFEGKIIRNIDFRTVNLFAPAIDDYSYVSTGVIERTKSLLHFGTSEKIILNNLLFSPGEPLDPFTIADNERILRQLPYIEDARIYVYENAIDPDYVDVVIFTKDRLSFGFDLDLSDIDRGGVEFYNKSILGLGQAVSTNLLFNAAESSPLGFASSVRLRNIGRTFLETDIDYHDAFSNRIVRLSSGRRFVTPTMKYAGGFDFTTSRLRGEYLFHDTTFFDQPLDFNEYDAWFGRSFILQGDGGRRNFYLTARYNRSVFFARPEVSEKLRYDFHNKDIILLGLAYTRQEYRKGNYIHGFGPTEDIPLGTALKGVAGYELNEFSTRWYGGADISHANYFNRFAYMHNRISLGSFINNGSFEQGVLNIESSGFSALFTVKGFYLRQFFSVNYLRGLSRFGDEFISLSNREGIRGLRSEMLRGRNKLAIQTETMLYSPRNWYGFRYAIFTMADLGWINPGNGRVLNESFYSGFGIGLRVRNEHLVFPTLNFRVAWFPRIPDSASVNLLYIMSERSRIFSEFNVNAPSVIQYREH